MAQYLDKKYNIVASITNTTSVAGKFGNGASFSSSSSSVFTVLNKDSVESGLGTSNFTIEAWINPNLTQATWAPWVRSSNSYIQQSSFTTGIFQINVQGASADWNNLLIQPYSSSVPVIDGISKSRGAGWQHIAVTREGNVLTLFVNGIPEGTALWTASFDSAATSGFSLGQGSSAEYFAGIVDDFRVTVGLARYKTSWSPPTLPTAALPTDNTDPLWNCVVLRLTCDGTNGSTTFTDSSQRLRANPSITGAAQLSTAQKKFGTASIYFDGTAAISYPDSIDWWPKLGGYTLELWVCPDVTMVTGGPYRICGQATAAGGNNVNALAISSGVFLATCYDGATNQTITTSVSVVANQWFHLCLLKKQSTFEFWIDGVLAGTGTLASSLHYADTNSAFSFGRMGDYVGQYYKGYIDDIRITKGVARNSTVVTPPASAFASTVSSTDANFSKVVSLLGFDDQNLSKSFQDVLLGNWTASGSAGDVKILTGSPPVGTSYGSFSGTNSYLSVAADNALEFSKSDLTVELWVNFSSVANTPHIFQIGINSTYRWGLRLASGSLQIFSVINGTTTTITSATVLSTATWYHVALCKDATSFRIYLNGTLDTSGAAATTMPYSATTMVLGWQDYSGGAGDYFAGFLRDFRVTKGLARYTSNFTAPDTTLMSQFSGDPYWGKVRLLHDLDTQVSSITTTETFRGVYPATSTNVVTHAHRLAGTVSVNAVPVGAGVRVVAFDRGDMSYVGSTVTKTDGSFQMTHLADRTGKTTSLTVIAYDDGNVTTSSNLDNSFSKVVASLPFDGVHGQSSIVDATGRLWTTVGTCTISSSSYNFGQSLNISGSTSYIKTPTTPDLDLAAQDFTIEFFVNPTSLASMHLVGCWGGSNRSWVVYLTAAGALQFSYSTNGAGAVTAFQAGTLTAGIFNHVAVTRSGSTIYGFVNGALIGQYTADTDSFFSSSLDTTIGYNPTDAYGQTSGYIDDLRITVGACRYTSGFTPTLTALPTLANTLIDTNLEAVASTLLFEGVSGTNTISDSRGKVWTAAGAAMLSAAQFKFGNTSLALVPSTGDYLSTPASEDFGLGTQDFTLEMWVRPDAQEHTYPALLQISPSGGSFGTNVVNISFGHPNIGTPRTISFWCYDVTGSAATLSGSTSLTLNTWTHVAITRHADTLRLFINGMLDASTTTSLALTASTPMQAYLGSSGLADTAVTRFKGYIDDFRLTRGVCRYKQSFVPVPATLATQKSQDPLDPYFQKVRLVLSMEGVDGSAGLLDSGPLRKTVTVTGGLTLSSASVPFGSTAAYFDGIDDVVAVADPSLNFASCDFTVELWFRSASVNPNVQQIIATYCADDIGAGLGREDLQYCLYFNTTNDLLFGLYTANLYTAAQVSGKCDMAWHHAAIHRKGNTFWMAVDGTIVGSSVLPYTFNGADTGWSFRLGAAVTATPFNGYIKDVRVTRGVARYQRNFSVSKEALPDIYTNFREDSYFSSVTLLLPGSGVSGATVTTDVSPSPKTLTGTYSISHTKGKLPAGSLKFTGTSSFLSATSATFLPGTGDMTVEFWFCANVQPQDTTAVFSLGDASGYVQIILWSTQIKINRYNGSAYTDLVSVSKTLDTNWHHFAYVVQGGVHKVFYDGIFQAASSVENLTYITQPVVYLGSNHNTGSSCWNGHIQDFRMTSVARYSQDFTVPVTRVATTASTDPYYSNVVLLLPLNGSNGSVVFTDYSSGNRTLTAVGTASIATGQSKFGGASLYGSGITTSVRYTQAGSDQGFQFGTGDFTIEGWFRPDSVVSSLGNLWDFRPASINGVYITVYQNDTGIILYVNAVDVYTVPSGVFSAATWVHIALCRTSGITRFFINGIPAATSYADTNSYSCGLFAVGGTSFSTNGNFAGYVDDFRITKGIARYDTTFDVPVVPNPTTATPVVATSSGVQQYNAVVYDSIDQTT